MKRPLFLSLTLASAIGVLALSGCRTVREGPGTQPDPNQRGLIYGTEPEHAPIPQKDVPEGESSLRKRGADQRIDQPKS